MYHLVFLSLFLALGTIANVDASPHIQRNQGINKRFFVNQTVLDVCKSLKPAGKVFYNLSPPFESNLKRYIASTSQIPTCLYLPTEPQEISTALETIANHSIPFAVSSGRHASNKGFSTTKGGIQIDLKGFQQVKLSSDKSYVDIGSGNIWDNVYQALGGTGVNIVGGRVTGVGVGGFLTGGGGYSWKTNQYGLTGDTLLQADLVLPNGTLATASASENSDLFWAIRGGGNKFGIIYNWRLKTVTQSNKVYGGLRTYTVDQIPSLLEAVASFSANNTDPKAQAIPTFNTLVGVPGVSLLFFYDDENPGTAADYFNAPSTSAKPFTDSWKAQSFSDLVRATPSNATAYTRGLFHTVSLESYSLPLLQQIANQSAFWGSRPLRSGTFISYDVEPFLKDWAKNAEGQGKAGAWPHETSPLPLNIYYAWTNPLDDEFYRNAAIESAALLTSQAKAEGQQIDDMYLYPNYALSGTPTVQIFGEENTARLSSLQKQYDPSGVMDLTTYFDF